MLCGFNCTAAHELPSDGRGDQRRQQRRTSREFARGSCGYQLHEFLKNRKIRRHRLCHPHRHRQTRCSTAAHSRTCGQSVHRNRFSDAHACFGAADESRQYEGACDLALFWGQRSLRSRLVASPRSPQRRFFAATSMSNATTSVEMFLHLIQQRQVPSVSTGVLVVDVDARSPAEAAGVKAGDVLVAYVVVTYDVFIGDCFFVVATLSHRLYPLFQLKYCAFFCFFN
jgi:hypothetical protein